MTLGNLFGTEETRERQTHYYELQRPNNGFDWKRGIGVGATNSTRFRHNDDTDHTDNTDHNDNTDHTDNIDLVSVRQWLAYSI